MGEAWPVFQPMVHLAPEMRDRTHVEEVHAAEHDHGETDLRAQETDRLGDGAGLRAQCQRQRDEADVDQAESHHKQVIGGTGQLLIVAEALDQEHDAVLRKRVFALFLLVVAFGVAVAKIVGMGR